MLGATQRARDAPFAESTRPHRQSVDVPLILLSSARAAGEFPRDVLGQAHPDRPALRRRRQALASLINNLALHNQLPRASQAISCTARHAGQAKDRARRNAEPRFRMRLRGFFRLAASAVFTQPV